MRAVHPVAVRFSSPQHSTLPRCKRRLALALALLFTWSAGFALPLQALAQQSAHERAPQPRPALSKPHDDPSWHTSTASNLSSVTATDAPVSGCCGHGSCH